MAYPLRDDTPTRQVPWVTIGLIVANVVIFLFLQPSVLQTGGSDGHGLTQKEQQQVDVFTYRWGVVPCEVQHLKPLADGIKCTGEQRVVAKPPTGKVVLLSLLTSMFIHASLAHLAGNMLFLWVFGAAVEDRLGPVPYFLFYVVTGAIAAVGHSLFHWNDAVPVLGASGAVAGLLGAYLVFRPRGRVLSIVLWTVVYVPAWVLLVLFFVTQFFTPDSAHVAWEAHAVGMAAGVLFALGLARIFPDPLAPVAPPPVRVATTPFGVPALGSRSARP